MGLREDGREGVTMQPILVWKFKEAPEHYRKLSTHGGDEDWLAFIPDEYIHKYGFDVFWAEEGSSFGCCRVSETEINGGVVLIGAHA